MRSDPMHENITLQPGLEAADSYANYWIRQVVLRLRREICWCWQERGMLPAANSAELPPFGDRAASALNISRFREEKEAFYATDQTARYLTEQLHAARPAADPGQGSFSWVSASLCLDDISMFTLALGLASSIDGAMGSVISSCLNDPAKMLPNLSLVQRLWDDPAAALSLTDPAHPLFSYGIIQRLGRDPYSQAYVDWDTQFTVPSIVSNQLLFPDSLIPQVFSSVMTTDDDTWSPMSPGPSH